MANPQWHDRLRQELEKRGLPATYCARLLEELTEHWNDLQGENQSMEAHLSAEARLGVPEVLAAAAKREYQQRTFAGRHPFLIFVLGAFLVTLVAWHLLAFVCVPLKSLVTPFKPVTLLPPSSFEWFVACTVLYVLRFLPFAVLAPLFIRACRQCCRPMWGMLACGIVAYLAFINDIGVVPPNDQHNLAVFFTWQFGLLGWQTRLLQAGIPLIISSWTWWRFDNSLGAPSPPLPLSAATNV